METDAVLIAMHHSRTLTITIICTVAQDHIPCTAKKFRFSEHYHEASWASPRSIWAITQLLWMNITVTVLLDLIGWYHTACKRVICTNNIAKHSCASRYTSPHSTTNFGQEDNSASPYQLHLLIRTTSDYKSLYVMIIGPGTLSPKLYSETALVRA